MRPVKSEVSPTLLRCRVAQRRGNRAWLNEYACPVCGNLKYACPSEAKRSPLCKLCGGGVKHGMSDGDPRYQVWACMKDRCTNPKNKSAKHYVLRGITVCPEWMEFDGFRQWSGFSDYRPGLFLDRIDNDKGYSPENCRWVTRTESNRNQTTTKLNHDDARAMRKLYSFGVPQAEIASVFGVTRQHVWKVVSGNRWATRHDTPYKLKEDDK